MSTAQKTALQQMPQDMPVFRLAYRSRARTGMESAQLSTLIQRAAERNAQAQISGVLLHHDGAFLQWLEGPADAVCSLMARISEDPRHEGVDVLSAGWMLKRRFPRWSMALSDPSVEPEVPPLLPPLDDIDHAMAAFDLAAHLHARRNPDLEVLRAQAQDFAGALMGRIPRAFPQYALRDLQARAAFVEGICAVMAQGWHADTWSSADIAVGLARLNALWQSAGRAEDPIKTRHSATVVVVPQSKDVLGAIVTADMLRAAGTLVHVVLEETEAACLRALASASASPLIVVGASIAQAQTATRLHAFAQTLRDRFPERPVHISLGAASGLGDLPHQVAFRRDQVSFPPGHDIPWPMLGEMIKSGVPR